MTKRDITDAIADLKALIRQTAQDRTRKGKIAEIKALRARKQEFEAKLAEMENHHD